MGRISRNTPNSAEPFDPGRDPFTITLIRRKVAWLVRMPTFATCDEEDLFQELLSEVVKSLGRLNGDVGHRNPFITAVVERQFSTLCARHRAAKRNTSRVTSLNVETRTEEGQKTQLAETLDARVDGRRTGRDHRRSEAQLADLRLDLARVIAEFPPEWQRMLELCGRYSSLSDVARQMGLPRTTVSGWMREVRRELAEKNFQDYFEI